VSRSPSGIHLPSNDGGEQATEEYYYPNKMGRIILLSVEEVMATFKYGLKEFGPVLGIADLAFRLFPLHMKVKIGAEVFAETFNKFSDQRVRIVED